MWSTKTVRAVLGSTATPLSQNKGTRLAGFPEEGRAELSFKASLSRLNRHVSPFIFIQLFTTAFRLFNQKGDGFGETSRWISAMTCAFSWYNDFVFAIKEQILTFVKERIFPEIQGSLWKDSFQGLDYESAHLLQTEAPEIFTVLENSYSLYPKVFWMMVLWPFWINWCTG